jgi:hypothetical protein
MHSIEALRYVVDEMQSSAKRILEYSRNKSATGLQRERILEAYLRKMMPKAFDIGSGFVYGKEKSSKQVDLIIYDQLNFAPFFDEGGYKIVLPQSVIHAIEVKSYLDKFSLYQALDNILSVTELNQKTIGIVFAFEGLSLDKTLDYINDYVSKLENKTDLAYRMPQMIVNLGKWIIRCAHNSEEDAYLVYTSSLEKPFEEQFLYFFVQIYYTLYEYRRKLCPEGTLPSLEEQGFQVTFWSGKSAELVFKKKT